MKLQFFVLIFISYIFAEKEGYYLKYGVEKSYVGGSNFSANGFPGNGGGNWSMRKMYTRCLGPKKENNENNYCNEPKWIGFTGENLQSAVAENPRALKTANFIKTTTFVQIGSVIMLPIFMGLFVAEANSNQEARESGNLLDVTPLAKIYLGCLAGSFINYVGWNVAEGIIARKSINEFNAEAKLTIMINSRLKSEIVYNF